MVILYVMDGARKLSDTIDSDFSSQSHINLKGYTRFHRKFLSEKTNY